MRRSECPICPLQVTQCVHLDGRVLQLRSVLLDTAAWYHVCGPAPVEAGRCCGYHIGECARVHFDDLPAAEAEFERRAEELRQTPFVKQAQEQ